jgi:hypothetical protein
MPDDGWEWEIGDPGALKLGEMGSRGVPSSGEGEPESQKKEPCQI